MKAASDEKIQKTMDAEDAIERLINRETEQKLKEYEEKLQEKEEKLQESELEKAVLRKQVEELLKKIEGEWKILPSIKTLRSFKMSSDYPS